MSIEPSHNVTALLAVWDKAVSAWNADKGGSSWPEIATMAMSNGSLFTALLNEDPLLGEIHHNFGLLEVPDGWEGDPDNKQLWQHQLRLIAGAKKKYCTA